MEEVERERVPEGHEPERGHRLKRKREKDGEADTGRQKEGTECAVTERRDWGAAEGQAQVMAMGRERRGEVEEWGAPR